MRNLWWLAVLAPLSCGPEEVPRLTVNWVFVNSSGSAVNFKGIAEGDTHVFVPVGPGSSQSSSTNLDSQTRQFNAEVQVTGGSLLTTVSHAISVAVDNGQSTVTITATWDGTNLAVTKSGACSQSVTSNASLFEPSAAACEGPTWTLEGVTGQTSANWQGNSQTGIVTGTGALSIDFPQTVRPGETVTLGVTFTGAVNWQGPGGPPIVLTLKEFVGVGGVGYIANATKSIGTASPTASGSLTASPSYTFPASNAGNKIEITIQASMNLFTFFFAPDPVATYRLSP